MDYSILLGLARSISVDDFVHRLPDPVLILLSDEELEEFSVDSDTRVGDETGEMGGGRTLLPPQLTILPVRKTRGHDTPDRITLGRSRGCDIILRTPGVSKNHAQFLPGKGGLEVEDLGSQNGTFVRGARLSANRPCPVDAGSEIQFGDVYCRLATAVQLYEILRAR